MYGYYLLVVLVLGSNLWDCGDGAAAAHGHGVEHGEREEDGSYRPRDHDHYADNSHNTEFDHEAILGSVKEAEEFDKLSPEEARRRLGEMLPSMDLNADKYIDRQELHKWILSSFKKLAVEEAQERMAETDYNRDGLVSWEEYLQEAFGVDSEEEVWSDDIPGSRMLVSDDKLMFKAADANGDGVLDMDEFMVFSNPDEHEAMHPYLVNQTMREKDTNQDGIIDFQEFVADKGVGQDREWLIAEKDKFDSELDLDHNGVLDLKEVHRWIIPNNEEIATEEVDHLFAASDDDHDDLLSFDEVLEHHDVFVGSEAYDDSDNYLGEHFDDEL